MSKPENVTCPECGGPMTSRVNGKTGQRFWGCLGYPQCRGTLDTDGQSPEERRGESRRWAWGQERPERRRWDR